MQPAIAGRRASETPRQSRTGRRAQDNVTIILFLLPALVVFLTFVVYPIFQSVYYSLFDWKGLGKATDFVGLGNYANILRDQIFLKAVRNGFVIVFLSLTIQLPLALVLALMVGRDLPGRTFFRVIFFLPFVFSEVITAIMWLGLFNPDPDRGYLNALLVLIPGVKSVAWLGNLNTVLACIFVVLTWKYFGLYMLLFMAGLQNIPAEIEEAARIDGASGRQMLTRITVPLLGSTIRTCVYLSVVGSLAAIHPGLDHDQGRAGQRQRSHGDLHVPFWLCALLVRIRRRRGDCHVPDLPGFFAGLPVAVAATGLPGRYVERIKSWRHLPYIEPATGESTGQGSGSTLFFA